MTSIAVLAYSCGRPAQYADGTEPKYGDCVTPTTGIYRGLKLTVADTGSFNECRLDVPGRVFVQDLSCSILTRTSGCGNE